ncbi:hypothetical protein LTR05_001943 [Lithohypha guttulata]|uniref:Uncharacterized protein n=1 Tax=Lithohypha guttulata TaxID=1690604 RepID=A0AAN7YKL8_9EURO|nr:hypothetical protein LTR05_001943 [Lithohypha guttulata]
MAPTRISLKIRRKESNTKRPIISNPIVTKLDLLDIPSSWLEPRTLPDRQHETPPNTLTTFMPSTEYLPCHTLALHKIQPSHQAPDHIQMQMNQHNDERERARNLINGIVGTSCGWITPPSIQQRRNAECIVEAGKAANKSWEDFTESVSHSSNHLVRAKKIQSSMLSSTSSSNADDCVNTCCLPLSKQSRERTQSTCQSGPRCPRRSNFSTRRAFDKAYIKYSKRYSKRRQHAPIPTVSNSCEHDLDPLPTLKTDEARQAAKHLQMLCMQAEERYAREHAETKLVHTQHQDNPLESRDDDLEDTYWDYSLPLPAGLSRMAIQRRTGDEGHSVIKTFLDNLAQTYQNSLSSPLDMIPSIESRLTTEKVGLDNNIPPFTTQFFADLHEAEEGLSRKTRCSTDWGEGIVDGFGDGDTESLQQTPTRFMFDERDEDCC